MVVVGRLIIIQNSHALAPVMYICMVVVHMHGGSGVRSSGVVVVHRHVLFYWGEISWLRSPQGLGARGLVKCRPPPPINYALMGPPSDVLWSILWLTLIVQF